ncbi:hypothetical protein EV401DRAFT_1886168 [Pisolithus croceorrhizus]|nr:hypothetical protein EV401DRAFT_1886168 [Pisolithus croceorrhizus]
MARTRSPDLSGRLTRVLGAIHGAHSHFFLNTFWAATTRVFSIFQIIVWGNKCEVRRPLLYRAEGRAVPELITYRDVGRLAVSLKGKGIDDRREPWWCARLSAHGAAGSRRPIQVASIWIRLWAFSALMGSELDAMLNAQVQGLRQRSVATPKWTATSTAWPLVCSTSHPTNSLVRLHTAFDFRPMRRAPEVTRLNTIVAYERGIVVHECCADSCSSKDQVLHMSWVPQTCCTQDDRFVPNSKYSKVGTSLLVIPWDVHGELLNAGLTISHHPLADRRTPIFYPPSIANYLSGGVSPSDRKSYVAYCSMGVLAPPLHGYEAPTLRMSIKKSNCQLGNGRRPGLHLLTSWYQSAGLLG